MKSEQVVTVLIIDDEADVRESIATYLDKTGYRVIIANSGAEGLDRFHSSCPDITLLDIELSGESSYETLATFLNLSPDHPIILLASGNQTDELIRCMHLGVSEYILKPISNLDMLGLVMANSLKRARLIAQNNNYRKRLELINEELESRVEVFRHDQQAGRHVQLNMLPNSPETISRYEFSHYVIPSLYLSGDSVDYKPLSKHRTAFYIADVSGHGSASAFVTTLLRFRMEQMRREYIRSRYRYDYSPAKILSLLNSDLVDSGLDKHITFFMGVLDQIDRTLTYSVAGHYPLPILYCDGEARFIPVDKPSFPLGLTADADYFEQSWSIKKGFTLTLFSDGILEYLSQRNIHDRESCLLNTVSDNQGNYEAIKTALNLEHVTNVPDDIAIMSVKSV